MVCHPEIDPSEELLKIQFPNVIMSPHPPIWQVIIAKFFSVSATGKYFIEFTLKLLILFLFILINLSGLELHGRVYYDDCDVTIVTISTIQ